MLKFRYRVVTVPGSLATFLPNDAYKKGASVLSKALLSATQVDTDTGKTGRGGTVTVGFPVTNALCHRQCPERVSEFYGPALAVSFLVQLRDKPGLPRGAGKQNRGAYLCPRGPLGSC